MKDDILYYVIGLGDQEDWEAGRGSLYWIEDPNGEHALPVFTTPEGASSYWKANSGVRGTPTDGGYDADDAPRAAAAESHSMKSHLQAN